MKIKLGIAGLFIVLLIILWLTTPTSPWSGEGFTSPTINARYIHLQHSQQGCLNLAEIRAYSYKGGPNLVSSSAVVTQSSPGPPSLHAVDRNIDSIAHTSCGDVPWLRVDLGKSMSLHSVHIVNRRDCCRNRAIGLVLSLLDDQQKPVYVAEPIKDKNGKTSYVDTPEHYTNMTDYPTTMTWYPPQPTPVYNETDENDLPPNMKCRIKHTQWDDEGGGNAVYLDRHNVECGPNETINRFRLVREANNKGPTGKYRYDYYCCQSNSPQPQPLSSELQGAPAKLISLEAELKRIQNQMQKDPAKLTVLEAEVQRIQQQLQKSSTSGIPASGPALVSSVGGSVPLATQSASPPSRQDVIPQNTLTQTGTDALVLGQQSSLLRDIQQAIRNEIYSDRATQSLF